jgi:hypothetical protein
LPPDTLLMLFGLENSFGRGCMGRKEVQNRYHCHLRHGLIHDMLICGLI